MRKDFQSTTASEVDVDINYYSRGGQCPYQAEGVINDKYYFYFRERHGYCRLELYKNKSEIVSDRAICDLGYSIIGINNDKEANKIIEKLFFKLKDIFDGKD